MAPPPLKRLRQTGDLRLTAEIDYAKLLHAAQVLEESSNFACCLSGDRGSVCAGSSAGVVTTWDLMAEGRPVAATWDAGVGAIYDMAVNGDVVVLGGDRGLGVAAALDVAGGGRRRRLAADAAPFRNGATPPTAEVNGVALDGGGCAPRRRQRVDVPAVYALCVAHDLPDLLEDCGIADDDDLGAASVLFAAGAAPVVDVSSGETELFTLAQA
ncbi:amylopectin binding protein [Aureococcus anophagefferens]|nr:amylopectin binding protein [Aureococcus anophagefferens]